MEYDFSKINDEEYEELFKDNEIMLEFDKDVFELMIEKVIIGEKKKMKIQIQES